MTKEELLISVGGITHVKTLTKVFVTIIQFYSHRLLFKGTVRNVTVISRPELSEGMHKRLQNPSH